MVPGIKASAMMMVAQENRLAVLSDNLANASATRSKAHAMRFFQPLPSPRAAGSVSPTDPAAPPSVPSFVTRVDLSPGVLQDTGKVLDLAIEGQGFFVLGGPGGPYLTRAGVWSSSRTRRRPSS